MNDTDGRSRVNGRDDSPVGVSGIRFRERFLCEHSRMGKAEEASDDSTESEKSVERKRRARTKRVADGIE